MELTNKLIAIGDAVRDITGKHTRIDEGPKVQKWIGTAAPNAGKYQHSTSAKCYEEIASFKLVLVSEEGPRPVFRYQSTEFEFDENNEAVVPATFAELFQYWMTNLYVINTDNPNTYSWDIEIYYVRPDGSLVSDMVEVKNTLTLEQMAEEISNVIPLPAEALHIKDVMQEKFINNNWNWFIESYGDKITTENISQLANAFSGSYKLTKVPFAINCVNYIVTPANLFWGCESLEEIEPFGYINLGGIPSTFAHCHRLTTEDIENVFINASFDEVQEAMSWNNQAGELCNAFENCRSMRKLPMNLIRNLFNPMADMWACLYYSGFSGCITLDEAVDIPVADQAEYWEDVLGSMLSRNDRLKEFTFETNDDGTPKTVRWAYQNLNFTDYIGWSFNNWDCAEQNTNITESDKVSGDETYNALKNSENWWSPYLAYSRYNHDSAVNTINSLPDCSAFLEEIEEGPNSIYFYRKAGEKTDGGAIGNLTEEEIAVAAAKGWTVTMY